MCSLPVFVRLPAYLPAGVEFCEKYKRSGCLSDYIMCSTSSSPRWHSCKRICSSKHDIVCLEYRDTWSETQLISKFRFLTCFSFPFVSLFLQNFSHFLLFLFSVGCSSFWITHYFYSLYGQHQKRNIDILHAIFCRVWNGIIVFCACSIPIEMEFIKSVISFWFLLIGGKFDINFPNGTICGESAENEELTTMFQRSEIDWISEIQMELFAT